MDDTREGGLVAWQWRLYPDNHVARANLILHLFTAPIFMAGTLLVPLGPLLGPWWLALVGLGGMLFTLGLQGAGHKREPSPPVPFRGPGDLVKRFMVEQWINFPRYVLSGELARAWRKS
jgi:hypothetical protein